MSGKSNSDPTDETRMGRQQAGHGPGGSKTENAGGGSLEVEIGPPRGPGAKVALSGHQEHFDAGEQEN